MTIEERERAREVADRIVCQNDDMRSEDEKNDIVNTIAAAIHKAVEEERTLQAKGLVDAWAKYVMLFGVPPHGSEKQLAALLELIPHKGPTERE